MSPSPSADVENHDSPSPSPTPPPPSTTSRLFSALRPSTSPASEPSPSSTSEANPSPSPHPGDVDEELPLSIGDPLDPTAPPAESGGTLSTGSPRVSKAGLRAAVGGGFRRLCRLVAVFAADEEERAYGLWAPDEEDVVDVAGPAANLIYRRVPEEARGGDVLDLVQLSLALGGYVAKNLQRRAVIRAHRQMQEAQGINPEES